ncbi:TonB-dependent receptor [Novosphingobium resinovorum]|uniref:TonB-dependent receptor n=1 Tax=Novosphingobium resinovorum TaxID=158500 RepID=UPI002ED407C4|nr:TonB-dependent receptor [Novosphingobium resinovorum]
MAIACVVATVPNIAFAQSTPPPERATQANAAIEEIVVTAQKRSERIQDVPISITAITGDSMTRRGINTADELTTAVPALTWQKSYNGAPFIRGVGKPIVTAGNESSVGIFVDGVLQISPLMTNFALNNVERVEVLKGPQGTLFGRNSNGGVINITTREPSHKPTLDASIGYANYETVEGKFYASTGLSDTLAVSVAGAYYDQSDGWGRNVTTGEDAYTEKSHDIRAKLLWEPTDRTKITLTGEYHFMRSQSNAYSPMAGTTALDGSTTAGFYNLTSDYDTYVRTKVGAGSLSVRHDMGWAQLVSISAYTDVRTFWPYDSDGSPTANLQGPIWETAKGFTQEVQLVSPSQGNFKWVAGLYYMYFDAAFNPIELNGAELGGARLEIFGDTKANSYAGFGEATWTFLPSTNLIVGGRMTFDSRSVSGHTDVDGAPGAVTRQSKNFSQPTWRVTLNHSFNPDLMVYGTVSTGYNSGQFNTGNAAAPAVQPEKLTAYEVGFKAQLFDRRFQLNASAFHYDYKDLQVTIVENAVTLQTNAAKARIDGFEVESTIVPIPGLYLDASVAYTNARYSDYENAQFYVTLTGGGYTTTTGDATGNRLQSAPRWSMTAGARYDIETEAGRFTPAVNYTRRGPYYWDTQNIVREPTQNLLGASLTYTSLYDRWSLRLWGKNLLNDKIRAWTIQRVELFGSTPSAPRTYGATLGVKM